MESTTVAVDLAKSVFEVAVANERGQITEWKRRRSASRTSVGIIRTATAVRAVTICLRSPRRLTERRRWSTT